MENFNPFDKLRASPSDKLRVNKNIEQDEKPVRMAQEKIRNKQKLFAVLFLLVVIVTAGVSWFLTSASDQMEKIINHKSSIINPTASPSSSSTLPPVPNSKVLSNGGYHIFQSFNNCGPAALSMTLRFYGINVSQAELGQALRPYQVPGGDNDDKSVTLEEVAEKSKEYDLIPYLRPMGNPEIIKQFITNDLPVITRTWTKPNEDIGHFRIVKGYDNSEGVFIQDDSLQNKNLKYAYADFDEIWKKFNYEYLVLVPKDKQEIAEQILGEDLDERMAWEKAVGNSLKELAENPKDVDAGFNLSVAYYKIGDYQKSVDEFEKVEDRLSFRTLWYQIEPILSYYQLENYDRVMQITDKILNNHNRAFSELYILRGKIYQKQGKTDQARAEFQKAVFYNSNLQEARDLLNSI